MTAPQRHGAEALARGLVTVERTRARREERELALEEDGARAALQALVGARLVVAGAGDEGVAYAIAHEAILRRMAQRCAPGWTRSR